MAGGPPGSQPNPGEYRDCSSTCVTGCEAWGPPGSMSYQGPLSVSYVKTKGCLMILPGKERMNKALSSLSLDKSFICSLGLLG